MQFCLRECLPLCTSSWAISKQNFNVEVAFHKGFLCVYLYTQYLFRSLIFLLNSTISMENFFSDLFNTWNSQSNLELKKVAISLRKTRWAHINVIERTPKRFFNCSHVLSLSLSNASEATRNQILINTRISHPFNVSPTLTKQNYMPALSKNVHHYSFIAPFHNYRGHT